MLVGVSSGPVMTRPYTARVLYDFTGELAGDLTVTAGEELTVLPHLEAGDGWVQATNREGEQGILPESYTEPIDQEEEEQSEDEEEERFNLQSVRPNTWDDDIDDDDERTEDSSQDPGALCLATGLSIRTT